MFDYIKGTLVEVSPHKAVIDVGGLGYRLHIPLSTYSKLTSLSQETLLYVSIVIREDSHKIYGFLTQQERDLFELIKEVSGIGPKTALTIVGHMEGTTLELAISAANIPLLSKIPGIGKKTAERLIIETKDRLAKLRTNPSLPKTLQTAKPEDHIVNDAMLALINLGYNSIKAQKAIHEALKECDPEPDLTTLITKSLQTL